MNIKEIRKKIPTLKGRIIIYGVLIIFFGIFFWRAYSTRSKNIKLIQKNDKLEKKVEKARHAKVKVEKFQKEGKKAIERKEKLVPKILPQQEIKILNLVEKISQIGSDLGIKDLEFNTGKLTKASSSKSAGRKRSRYRSTHSEDRGERNVGSTSSKSSSSISLYKYPVRIEFKGTYQQIIKFVIRMKKLNRMVIIENLHISSSTENLPYLSTIIRFDTYALLSSPTY